MIAAPTGNALIAAARLRDLFKSCPWMEHAFKEMGQHRYAGPENSPWVLEYLSQVGSFADDETSWCSAFANWCMKRAGIQGSGKPNAKSWLIWGTGIAQSTPCFGCVAVFTRPPGGWRGHVTFVVGDVAGDLRCLGGNQTVGAHKSSVCIKTYPRSRLLGLRWPSGHDLDAKLRHFVADSAGFV